MRAASLTLVTVLAAAVPARAELGHGLRDRGIFSELDARVALPLRAPEGPVDAALDRTRGVLVIYAGGAPLKAYPVPSRPGDAVEIAALLGGRAPREVTELPGGDRDRDGIPDALDILLGAKKVALNGARYEGGYTRLPYPGGDVPREIGVCTDVVVRALRNAGIDLQVEVHEDIRRAPRSYPMVRRRDPNIDHRRVKTILPWFRRHFRALGTDPRSQADPFRPGDIVFFDTFPSKPGPDHIGIVSDRRGENGLYLVVNNWTDGTVESEMDLLAFVPVTDRFRVR
jgi:uncharacterized protein YijF (DUF1287 family)